ncbi:hypothetical protein G7Z17_g5982 [Cylindrodendrum hubeiense]|uniref:Uncharacterized protein n=1 Tax=Cylindrodendrum hubeiense TaxID=595255 RepID=A0A9P5LFN7_9HYPO|nr:hypothetical protein G7Z17_g5982 [Cylindrodendrum hubeiense]
MGKPRLNKVKKEGNILRNAAKQCEGVLKKVTFDATTTNSLLIWLKKFNFGKKLDSLKTCEIAYEARNDPQMQMLRRLGQESHAENSSDGAPNPFRTVTHLIGRLAEHIRVAKQLLEDSGRLGRLLEDSKVDSVAPPVCVPSPEADSQTTLEGILTRILPAGDKRHGEYLAYLSRMDFRERIKEVYEKHKPKPRVHSEMQMHDHFYVNQFEFVDGDPFIGTSKFACYGCKLYFRHHPAGYVEPDSHEKAFLNWGPVALARGHDDPRWLEQRDVMNLIIKDIRDVALKQIQRQEISSMTRPDSITGITNSENEWFEDVYEFADVEDKFLSEADIEEGKFIPSFTANAYV